VLVFHWRHYPYLLQIYDFLRKAKRFLARILQLFDKIPKFDRQTKNHNLMQTQELVVIAEFNSYLEAELAKSIVASAGIYTEIRNEYMSTAYAVAIPPQLLVPYDDAEQAKTLLRLHP
jgi:hypothetical protein